MDTEICLYDPSTWSENSNYQHAFQMVSKWRVVNDTTEKDIKLIEDFNSIIPTNEEQKQFVLQIVNDNQKIFLDCKKDTFKRKL